MEVTTEMLARVQFAFTIGFHIVFPAFTIGVSAFVATLLVRWQLTGQPHLHTLARFWTKIFAVSFAMGVVSGIPMSYQFGSNWSRFSEVVGNVIGPVIGYEVLTAFFLEATFLGVMLFGWKRVPPWLHVTSAVLVALGTALSGFWILSANSWMHTPVGHEMRGGIAYPVDWLAIVFNPSFPYRFVHTMNAAYLTTSVVVLALGARYRLAGAFKDEACTMMRMGMGMVAFTAPLQLVIGDLHGLNTLEHQPIKVAAMEGHWEDEGPANLLLFAWPDEDTATNRYEIGIPKLGAFVLTHDWDGRFPGLRDYPRELWPPVAIVFWSFRVMVGIGFALIALGLVGLWLWRRGTLFDSRRFLWVAGYAWPAGFIAILAGWFTTEVGRQPWVVYGILHRSDAVSPVAFGAVAWSLATIVVVYSVVFSIGIYYVYRLMRRGPQGGAVGPPPEPEGLPSRPLSTANEPAHEEPEESTAGGSPVEKER